MAQVDPTISEEHQQDEDLVNNEPALSGARTTLVSGTDSDREVDVPEGSPDGSHHVEKDFFNPFDGTRGRAGGVYLDMQERVNAEALRAKSEGREPDFNNPPAVAGTPLVVDGMRVDNVFSNPASVPVNPVVEVDPVSTAAVDIGIATGTTDTTVLEQELSEAQARNDSASTTPETPADITTTTDTSTTPSSGGNFTTV